MVETGCTKRALFVDFDEDWLVPELVRGVARCFGGESREPGVLRPDLVVGRKQKVKTNPLLLVNRRAVEIWQHAAAVVEDEHGVDVDHLLTDEEIGFGGERCEEQVEKHAMEQLASWLQPELADCVRVGLPTQAESDHRQLLWLVDDWNRHKCLDPVFADCLALAVDTRALLQKRPKVGLRFRQNGPAVDQRTCVGRW